MGARMKWPKVQDMVARGLEQNDFRLLRVPRCSNFIIIPYMEPKVKTLGYERSKLKRFFYHRFEQPMVHLVLN